MMMIFFLLLSASKIQKYPFCKSEQTNLCILFALYLLTSFCKKIKKKKNIHAKNKK